jgi:hypothetical protein
VRAVYASNLAAALSEREERRFSPFTHATMIVYRPGLVQVGFQVDCSKLAKFDLFNDNNASGASVRFGSRVATRPIRRYVKKLIIVMAAVAEAFVLISHYLLITFTTLRQVKVCSS